MNKIDIENLFYIDSINGFNLALKSYNPHKDILVTDNPFIASDSITKNYVLDISKYVEDLFKEAFFVVNIDKIEWESKLKNILNLPKKDLQLQWNDKKNKRTFFIENYIHAPLENSSNRAVNYINKYMYN